MSKGMYIVKNDITKSNCCSGIKIWLGQ